MRDLDAYSSSYDTLRRFDRAWKVASPFFMNQYIQHSLCVSLLHCLRYLLLMTFCWSWALLVFRPLAALSCSPSLGSASSQLIHFGELLFAKQDFWTANTAKPPSCKVGNQSVHGRVAICHCSTSQVEVDRTCSKEVHDNCTECRCPSLWQGCSVHRIVKNLDDEFAKIPHRQTMVFQRCVGWICTSFHWHHRWHLWMEMDGSRQAKMVKAAATLCSMGSKQNEQVSNHRYPNCWLDHLRLE